MGKTLGLDVVGEGVETERQWDFLKEQGCDQVQGLLFSPPLSPEEFAQFYCTGKKSAQLI